MSSADCRAAVRAIRAAEFGAEAVRVARPRSVLGIVSSRGPLAVMLRVADAEGRLVRSGTTGVALLERPRFARLPPQARGGVGLRLLRLVDRRWDLLVFAVPPVLLLTAAAVMVLLTVVRGTRPSYAIVGLAIAAVVWVSVFMTAHVVTGSRMFAARTKDELAAESLPGFNWSMPLAHAGTGDEARLLRLAADRMEQLVEHHARRSARDSGWEPGEGGQVREVLVCLTRGATTASMRRVVAERLHLPYGPDSRVALRRPIGPVTAYREPVKAGGGFFLLWIGGVAVIVAVLAVFVADVEQQACGGAACAERPSTYATAVQWLAWHIVWQSAPGITAATWQTQVFGWLLGVVGLTTVAVTWVSAKLAISKHDEMLDDLKFLPSTRVLLMTVTDTERDAVLRTVPALTGRSFTGAVTTYDLGTIGATTLRLVQCPRQGSSAAQHTATEAIRQWRPDLVIMVGYCYGLREDWTREPQQLGDVIVATSIYDLDPRIEHEDRTEYIGPRPTTMSAIVSRFQAASTDWHRAAVRFGPLLSAQTLIDSSERRDALKREFSRALGGEMEGHGLYAAAAEANVPWILVKAVSDWGVDRRQHHRPAEAAANAADFVAHAVALGAFDDWPARQETTGPTDSR
ncbi:hypothetical protein ACTI_50460 [Actinoplanes sp. OR16]|uniref:5'-methylthioadenosine/S-adenosylhomocysteine nucleosidase family protein n=1 Tax=Actinoplanes sp. OR16 TaxID=946334 RepID=UPI000F6D0D58|nr:hypothetical protein [Actinoplanes sp. OR16]BBH68361.1 hypothetical protein ACTI_50460 [Actinoplanes sp. OR16]